MRTVQSNFHFVAPIQDGLQVLLGVLGGPGVGYVGTGGLVSIVSVCAFPTGGIGRRGSGIQWRGGARCDRASPCYLDTCAAKADLGRGPCAKHLPRRPSLGYVVRASHREERAPRCVRGTSDPATRGGGIVRRGSGIQGRGGARCDRASPCYETRAAKAGLGRGRAQNTFQEAEPRICRSGAPRTEKNEPPVASRGPRTTRTAAG
ncbi:hypothetical protein CRENBAI_003870 [Crenichthys baileyi]|uniref:Uncharacterized protein n=1 Tax=Crenichthys baileyi TaxID=28760 RepID=A0AAV9SRV7_9TELE